MGALASGQAIGQTRPWYELDTSWISVGLHLAVMEDGAFYTQDAPSEEQVGNLRNEQLFRVDDLQLAGKIKLARPWAYRIGGNYKGLDPTASRTWTSTYVSLAIPLADVATVTVGKQKAGPGLEISENARDLSFMERSTMSTAFAFIDSHIVGVRFSGAPFDERMTWSAGWFNNWLDDSYSFSESGQIAAGRVTGLPMDLGSRRLFHIGASAAYRQAPGGSLQLKSIPEVYEAPDFVDTGSFPADSATSVAGELAYAEGPVMVSAEYTSTWVSSPQTTDPHFDGFYITATWCLTGESRPYDRTAAIFGSVQPSRPFSFRHGGIGAWELAARYSHIDLTSGTLEGGEFDRWSAALGWRPTVQWRVEFNYGSGRLDKAGLVGRTNFYQLRLQFQL
jgi:phosphate-selective porin OprO/OprP